MTATAGTSAFTYNYDPLGRLDTVTAGAATMERNSYDGFDNIASHFQSSTGTTTTYAYDPSPSRCSRRCTGSTSHRAELVARAYAAGVLTVHIWPPRRSGRSCLTLPAPAAAGQPAG